MQASQVCESRRTRSLSCKPDGPHATALACRVSTTRRAWDEPALAPRLAAKLRGSGSKWRALSALSSRYLVDISDNFAPRKAGGIRKAVKSRSRRYARAAWPSSCLWPRRVQRLFMTANSVTLVAEGFKTLHLTPHVPLSLSGLIYLSDQQTDLNGHPDATSVLLIPLYYEQSICDGKLE